MDGDKQAETKAVTEVVADVVPEVVTEVVAEVETPKTETTVVATEPEGDKAPEVTKETEKTEVNADAKADSDKAEEPEVDVEELITEAKHKEAQVSLLTEQLQAEQTKVLSSQEKVAELEDIVKNIVQAKTASVPEAYRALIPEDNFTKQLEWLNKAEATGLFGKKENPEVEIGATMDLGKESKESYEELSAQQKLSNYFSNFYK